MATFTKEQWLTIITFVVVNFCNAMCVSMQVRAYKKSSRCRLVSGLQGGCGAEKVV